MHTNCYGYREIVTEYGINIYLADEKQNCVGSASATRCFGKADTWYFNRLWVKEDCRGQGCGSELLDRLLALIRETEGKLILEINAYGELNYEQLEAFYKRHGFQDYQKHSYIYDGGKR